MPYAQLRHVMSSVLAVACLQAGDAPTDLGAGGPIVGCTVITPTGTYASVSLYFKGEGKGAASWDDHGGLRNGVMLLSDGVGLREPGGSLTLKDGTLTGTYQRMLKAGRSFVDLGKITVEATVNGTDISGTASFANGKAVVKGVFRPEAALATSNAIPKDHAWPAAQGPFAGGCAAIWAGLPTVDDTAAIRLQWRSEEIDIGSGMGDINRFMADWKSTSQRASSGCSSPIIADGRLFFRYYVPAPDKPGSTAKLPNYGLTEAEHAAKLLAEAKAAGFKGEKLPTSALEKIYTSADDVVLCSDAATGKTLWKAVVKQRGTNFQHHKFGPFNMSPAYAQGRVFSLGNSGWLYAFDAATGKPLWEVKSELDQSNALLAVDNILVAPAPGGKWGGYDAATGKLLWSTGSRSVSTLSVWQHQGKSYLIGAVNGLKGIACLDAATGKELWNLPVVVLTGGRGLGPGGITISGDRMLVNQDNGTGESKAPNKPRLAAYALSLAKAEPLWELAGKETAAGKEPGKGKSDDDDGASNGGGVINNECVPVVVRGKYAFTADLRTVDLATGKVVGQGEGSMPANGGYMQVIEDLVLVRPDGTHGRLEIAFYKVGEDGSVKSWPGFWTPPANFGASSYHHPIFYPLVAGRMYLRHRDGVYCWDLRKPGR